jgi:hypothetical protein
MADRYQPIDRLKARIDYEPDDLFTNNEAKRFDRLLGGEAYVGDDPDGWAGLEAEARGMIETLSGDEPWSREVDRVDSFRPTDNAAIPLVYPIESISTVEIKRSQRDDFEQLEAFEYDHTDHHLVLPRDTRAQKRPRDLRPANELLSTTQRRTWYDVAVRVRVTYTRGFDPVPQNIQQIQVSLVNRMLRQLKGEQTIAAASPEEFAGVSPEMDAVLTERLRERINSLTPLGGGTRAV